MNHLLRTLAILIFFTSSVKTYSQLGISNYSLYVLGLNTNKSHRVSVELKTFANTSIESVQMEFDIFYNFKAKDYHRFSLGIGLNAYPFIGDDHISGFTFPFQWEIFPLQDFKRLSLLYELSGMLIVEDSPVVRNLFGIRYTFGDPT